MLLTTRNPEIETLRQELQTINTKLELSLDIEMQKLKEQERELQEALKFKSRTDLIKAMENELAMESLEESMLDLKSVSNLNSSFHQTMKSSNTFLKKDLKKSHQILDNLMREYNDQYKTNMIQSYNTDFKSLPNPNVIFSKSSKYSRTPQQSVKTVTIYKKPAEQNLNQQQTFVYGDSLSYNPYAKPNYNPQDYAKSIRDSYFYSDKETINGIPKSKIRKTTYLHDKDTGFTVLPVTKTLIHKKPWSYGKVETNYYSFRDSKLKKK
ncbi:hypothetical protein BpHYR1_038101 [Brachionus plicatilis]|uniref:Uncharacterized protein n=1 Tax=Brachionus plicatilis TaxID=10195 RepID=A0A3M7Q3T2_BRAPC|nr:hypothetical protein BpHYR1_038101 [Brachionus plicatilis]